MALKLTVDGAIKLMTGPTECGGNKEILNERKEGSRGERKKENRRNTNRQTENGSKTARGSGKIGLVADGENERERQEGNEG